MVKCEICHEKIDVLFLGKIDGTYIKKDKKLKAVCSSCQRKLKEKIKDALVA